MKKKIIPDPAEISMLGASQFFVEKMFALGKKLFDADKKRELGQRSGEKTFLEVTGFVFK